MKHNFNNIFYQQADLLISVIPYVFKENNFAMHGGTAINFFIRNMPRISVDIDMIYLKVLSRDESLKNISDGLNDIKNKLLSSLPGIEIEAKKFGDVLVSKLFIKRENALVKIEPNLIIRGTLFEPEERDICENAERVFEKFVSARIVSIADVYGSKICAALDRQHPRDLFDIRQLLEYEGISEEIRRAFIVYLISCNRPMSELLSPNFIDMSRAFEKEFSGMTVERVQLEDLIEARKTLVNKINKQLTSDEKEFLLSFKRGEPAWKLIGLEKAEKLPAVNWKLKNINKMEPGKHKKALEKLKQVLDK